MRYRSGQELRPSADVAIGLVKGIERTDGNDCVFQVDRGEGAFQDTKRIWPDSAKKAGLEGGALHTRLRLMGATATSTGDSLALIGAALRHANVRSTKIDAHVQHGPAIFAVNRVADTITAGLAEKNADFR